MQSQAPLQAIFLDRDGVINHERADYVKSWSELALLPGSLEALVELASLNLPIIVLTNQSVIGREIVPEATIDEIHQRLIELVSQAGGRIDRIYKCPHHPQDGCSCRKPQPGLLQQAAHDFALSLPQTIFIGDAITDYQAARAAGSQSILLRSGRQGSCLDDLLASVTEADEAGPIILPNLAAAVATVRERT